MSDSQAQLFEKAVKGGGEARRLGRWGEALVACDLERKGWTVLARNYCCRFGELDIVAQKDGVLAFVEVKLRRGSSFAPARALVTAEKQRKLRTAAELYLQEHPGPLQPRFDVAEVYAPQGEQTVRPVVTYIESAF